VSAPVLLSSAVAGALITLSLAPFGLWPLAIIAAGALYWLIYDKKIKPAFSVCLAFGLGLFLSGASWVYVSIHEFGYTPSWLAAVLTFLFCLLNAVVFAAIWCLYTWFNSRKTLTPWKNCLLFACVGLLTEQLRSWIFTGFPWLLVGYSQTESVLAGWAPIAGVYGISFIIYLTGAALAVLLARVKPGARLPLKNPAMPKRSYQYFLIVISLCWLSGPLLHKVNWTTLSEAPLSASLVQANISQHEKWDPAMLAPSLSLYRSMSSAEWQRSDVVIWPEAAVPREYHLIKPFLNEMSRQALKSGASFITGVPFRSPNEDLPFHNSIVALGAGSGIYHKRNLVPFGEYVPLEKISSRILSVFDLPLSRMQPGSQKQDALRLNNWQSLPLICYEIVYPHLTAKAAQISDALITVSNDSWFGTSIGPLQHMQMAQMRALENGRYLLRGTGNGVSAIVNPKGKITARSQQFEREVLQGNFYLASGNTPWATAGYLAIYWLAPLSLLWLFFSREANQESITS